ncbi:MAG: hydrogenase maturation nickel metallochaperone HypA [Candidatus Odinarchaeota archaeon]
MHEFSIAQMIHEQVLEILEQHGGKKVKRVKLKIGEFSLIQVEQLDFSLKILAEDDKRFDGDIYEYIEEKAEIYCSSCDYRGPPLNADQNPLIKESGFIMAYTCPTCRNNDTQVVNGSEMILESVELYT